MIPGRVTVAIGVQGPALSRPSGRDHDLLEHLLVHRRVLDRVSASTRRSRLRGIQSAIEMKTRDLAEGQRAVGEGHMRECVRETGRRCSTRGMFSDSPVIPGRRQQYF